MLNTTGIYCDICYDETYDCDPKNFCCGINVCDLCDFKSLGACYIHEPEEINRKIKCDDCEKIATSVTSGCCDFCDNLVCMKCMYFHDVGSCICYDVKCLEKTFVTLYKAEEWDCPSDIVCNPDNCCTLCEVEKQEYIQTCLEDRPNKNEDSVYESDDESNDETDTPSEDGSDEELLAIIN
tara:strand:+ start:601 stop:1143 length:543 start_codon:yes stop_codon:yes gene_type:complete